MCVGDCSVKVICLVISENFFFNANENFDLHEKSVDCSERRFLNFPFVNFCRLFITCCCLFVRVYFLPTMLTYFLTGFCWVFVFVKKFM